MMRRPRLAGFCVLLLEVLALPVAAHKNAGPDAFDPSNPGGEITIELDTARGRNADRSLLLALLGSAALPGAGEAYLGESRAAKSFLLAEAGFWAGLFISWQARESHLQSARNYVSDYADADASGWGEAMLERAVAYRASHDDDHRQDSYELYYVLTYRRELKEDHPNHPYWDFGSSNTPENTERWRDYQSIMRHYRGAKVAMSFAVGAMVLNRAASVAHTLRVYRRTSGKGLTEAPNRSAPPYRFVPVFGPDGSGMGFAVNF
jgi:hypothetical protein